MSSNEILNLEPKLLWKYFYEISQVPRPSKKEAKIIKYLEDFAAEGKIEYKKDEVGNIVMKIPASKGFENSPGIVLQSHIDMVCEKNKGTEHDFDNDPIKLKIENNWVTAEGTTLGSDNGIGVAAALAILKDANFNHGPIECLFTVDEETGLTGANNLKPGFISGKILLNLDSEEMGAIYIGCAGGVDTIGNLQLFFKDPDIKNMSQKIIVKGLKGGHSGLDINTGRANAIKLLARILNELNSSIKFELANIDGGSKRNAIPREAEAVIKFDENYNEKVNHIIEKFQNNFKSEFSHSDPEIEIKIEKSTINFEKVISNELKVKIIKLLLAIPHGVISMSGAIKELVETSTNLATIQIQNENLQIVTSQRSSIESSKNYIAKSVESAFHLADAKVLQSDGYPGWQPDTNSNLLKIAKDLFKKEYEEPEIKAIHAGLECGILSAKYPGLEIISFGPTITGAHSPDEKVNIKTVEEFYGLLKKLIEKIAEQN